MAKVRKTTSARLRDWYLSRQEPMTEYRTQERKRRLLSEIR